MSNRITRRHALAAGAAFYAGSCAPANPAIASIERTTIWRGAANGYTWFHPRPCLLPGSPLVLLMAVQKISGSDVYGTVHLSRSEDLGATWSSPKPIPGLERIRLPGGREEAIADTVPQYHPQTAATIFLGWNVYYQDDKLTQPNSGRWPVYCVRRPDGSWGPRQKLTWDHPEANRIYGSNCSQRLTLPNGNLLIPMTYASYDRQDRVAGTLLCGFDGERIEPIRTGNYLQLAVKRGLLEPSLMFHEGVYFMTIRAEDGHGYVSRSADGLQWAPMRPWTWEDGTPLEMSTTQQHWLQHSSAPHLVYTRKTESNAEVMRWRTPLFAAQFDPDRLCLLRDSETTVFPMSAEELSQPAQAARLGNFHTVEVNAAESLVTVGQSRPGNGYLGDTLQARVAWSRPNQRMA